MDSLGCRTVHILPPDKYQIIYYRENSCLLSTRQNNFIRLETGKRLVSTSSGSHRQRHGLLWSSLATGKVNSEWRQDTAMSWNSPGSSIHKDDKEFGPREWKFISKTSVNFSSSYLLDGCVFCEWRMNVLAVAISSLLWLSTVQW